MKKMRYEVRAKNALRFRIKKMKNGGTLGAPPCVAACIRLSGGFKTAPAAGNEGNKINAKGRNEK